MSKDKALKGTTRRKFLKAAAATSVATMALPTIAKAQEPITWRWQSTWPAPRTSSTNSPATSPRRSTT